MIKRPWGFWFHKGKLDPTAVRSYPNATDFIRLLAQHQLEVVEFTVSPIRFPVIEGLIRLLNRFGLITEQDARLFFVRRPRLKILRRLLMPVPGYSNIEVLARRI